MLVSEILRNKGSEVYSVQPDITVYDAIKDMADKNIGALLVLDDTGLCGIISERDYRNKVILKGRTSKTTKVHEIMSGDVLTVSPQETIETCMTLMTENKIRHLPVVQNDDVKGVISIGDLVKAIISKQEGEINDLRHYISGDYPT